MKFQIFYFLFALLLLQQNVVDAFKFKEEEKIQAKEEPIKAAETEEVVLADDGVNFGETETEEEVAVERDARKIQGDYHFRKTP